ncbi:hypothetical protein FQN57_005461 [Myotisia sp. PD_48]|nr:hypothetical protein FQN57_005461 [Myotisia sp. PD_48]
MPCENCVKRSDASSCSYAQITSRRKNHNRQSSPSTPDDMQNRIDRLEGLVLSLMTNGSQSAGPTAAMATVSGSSSVLSQGTKESEDLILKDEESDTEQVTKSFGIMKFDNQSQKSYYVSEAHWSTILSDISEVKQFFITHKKQYEDQMEKVKAAHKSEDLSGSALIFGAMKMPTESEIMSSFPSKYTTDMLYAAHWQDPSKTNIVWIGLVFSMMRLAMISYHKDKDEPPEFRGKALDMAKTFRTAMAQSLVLADFTKPHRYLLETLLLHLQGEYSQSRDSETSVWILVGMIVRLGMRMGYHRDSKMFSNISVFQGEMRRRVWTWARQADLLFSFQTGLPSMVRTGDTDTDLPRSLYDEDFDEDCKELPPERPFDEPTPVTYIIATARLSAAFGRVLEQSQKIKGSSYDEVMEIDAALRRAREMIPEWLNVVPISECENESTTMILNRFGVLSIYHKAQCVLHRPFLVRARENPRYMLSRRACVESSLELLRFQSMLYAETRPDGRLRNGELHTTFLNSHDFLIACTILALDLYNESNTPGHQEDTPYSWGVSRQEETLAALRQSYQIWNESKDESIDAWKASVILGLLLEKLNECSMSVEGIDGNFDPQDEKQNAAMTLGLLSSGLTPLGPTSPPQFPDPLMRFDPGQNNHQAMPTNVTDQPGPLSPFGMFGQMPDMQQFNLDWEAWDNYIQTASLDTSSQNWAAQNGPFDFQQLQHQTQVPLAPGRGVENSQNLSNNRPPTFPAANEWDQKISLRHALYRAASAAPAQTIFAKSRSTASSLAFQLGKPIVSVSSKAWTSQTRLFSGRFALNEQEGRWNSGERSGSGPAFRQVNARDRDGDGDRSGFVANRPPPTPKDTVYVGNLFFDVTAQDLKTLSAEFGEVVTSRVIYDGRGLSRGFGYVKFDSIESAQKAIDGLHFRVHEGRRLNVNFATTGLPEDKSAKGRSSEPSRTLYVGNIDHQITERELHELFADVPNVFDVRVAVDRRTGMPRGFVHAEFTDVESAQAGFEILRVKAPYGRPLRIDYSESAKRNITDPKHRGPLRAQQSSESAAPEGTTSEGTTEGNPNSTPQ